MRYLDPKADLTFKKIFGEHKDLLILDGGIIRREHKRNTGNKS